MLFGLNSLSSLSFSSAVLKCVFAPDWTVNTIVVDAKRERDAAVATGRFLRTSIVPDEGCGRNTNLRRVSTAMTSAKLIGVG